MFRAKTRLSSMFCIFGKKYNHPLFVKSEQIEVFFVCFVLSKNGGILYYSWFQLVFLSKLNEKKMFCFIVFVLVKISVKSWFSPYYFELPKLVYLHIGSECFPQVTLEVVSMLLFFEKTFKKNIGKKQDDIALWKKIRYDLKKRFFLNV